MCLCRGQGPNTLSETMPSASRIDADVGLSFFMVHAGWPEAYCKFTLLQASKALPFATKALQGLQQYMRLVIDASADLRSLRGGSLLMFGGEHSIPGARPMNTATVSLHAGRGRFKCGRRSGSLWTVPGERCLAEILKTIEAPISFVDWGKGAPATSTKHMCSIGKSPAQSVCVEFGVQSSWMRDSVTIRSFVCEKASGLITCTDHSESGSNCAPVLCYQEHSAHTLQTKKKRKWTSLIYTA